MGKKILTLITTFILFVSLVACGTNKNILILETTNPTELTVVETKPVTEDTTIIIEDLGWKINPTDVDNAIPEEVKGIFEFATNNYECMFFEPVAYIGFNNTNDKIHRFLCKLGKPTNFEEQENNTDFVPSPKREDLIVVGNKNEELYLVNIAENSEESKVIDVDAFDFDLLMNMTQEESDTLITNFESEGWQYSLEQPTSKIPTAVANILPVLPSDVTPIHFMGVHRSENGTLIFAILGRKTIEKTTYIASIFISVSANGDPTLLNIAPVI